MLAIFIGAGVVEFFSRGSVQGRFSVSLNHPTSRGSIIEIH
ncbi:hypothetical protein GGI52_005327 [Pseudomonas moraviensis]|uniref:Uncharacterized protein n=1 Tax=Pseudomonas moraviensis TaxID=321662 RepID=A0A7Y9W168_9PSED|nr:hypothetical protein [Pseudomonas moraviensis]